MTSAILLGRTVHGGSAFSATGDGSLACGGLRCRKAASVHDGHCFAMYERMKLKKYPIAHHRRLTQSIIDVLNEDVLSRAVGVLCSQMDVQSLEAVKRSCSTMCKVARPIIQGLALDDLAHALAIGTIPLASTAGVEQQLARAFLDGALAARSKRFVIEVANKAIKAADRHGDSWVLGSAMHGDSMDRAVRLRGLDDEPVTTSLIFDETLGEQRPVADWYSEHCAHTPLKLPHLPCALTGPPRYLERAGTAAAVRRIKRTPIELLHVIRAPTMTQGQTGHALIVHLLPRYVPH